MNISHIKQLPLTRKPQKFPADHRSDHRRTPATIFLQRVYIEIGPNGAENDHRSQ